MAERGRRSGFRMTEEHRLKIKNSNILNALIEHVEGQREMSPTQVTAGLGLLRKVMPDLSQSSVEHTIKQDATDYSRDELIAIVERSRRANGGAGTLEADGCPREPDSVH